MRVSHRLALEQAARLRRRSLRLLVLGGVLLVPGGYALLAGGFSLVASIVASPLVISALLQLVIAYESWQASRRIRREADIEVF